MVYSQLFDGLPQQVSERVYRRLYDVLTGTVTSPKYAGLSASDREPVLEILIGTKRNLPSYWTSTPGSVAGD